MNKQNIVRYLQSIVAIPMLAVVIPLTGVQKISDMTLINDNKVEVAPSVITTQEKEDLKKQADQIDAFFALYDAPLEGYGMKFALEAKNNDIDWRLLPAIAMRESTGGKSACKKATHSVFGYGSCKMNFKSIDDSIEIVAKSLGGNNPRTASHYDGKTTLQILRSYNSVIHNYPNQVVKIMKMINDETEVI